MAEPQTPEEEFQVIQKEITDEDPVVRGIAAVDLGSFGTEHPEYKDQAIALLEKCLNDPDDDVRTSAQTSLDLVSGKQILEAEEGGKQVIAFGYLPEEYQHAEAPSKQSWVSCICCIVMLVILIITMVYLFLPR